MAAVASAIVDGSASAMSEATVRRWSGQVWPSVPSATWLRKRPNWTMSGWSRSMQRRISTLSMGSARSPSRLSTGSPGMRCTSKNTSTETPSTAMRLERRRRRRKLARIRPGQNEIGFGRAELGRTRRGSCRPTGSARRRRCRCCGTRSRRGSRRRWSSSAGTSGARSSSVRSGHCLGCSCPWYRSRRCRCSCRSGRWHRRHNGRRCCGRWIG